MALAMAMLDYKECFHGRITLLNSMGRSSAWRMLSPQWHNIEIISRIHGPHETRGDGDPIIIIIIMKVVVRQTRVPFYEIYIVIFVSHSARCCIALFKQNRTLNAQILLQSKFRTFFLNGMRIIVFRWHFFHSIFFCVRSFAHDTPCICVYVCVCGPISLQIYYMTFYTRQSARVGRQPWMALRLHFNAAKRFIIISIWWKMEEIKWNDLCIMNLTNRIISGPGTTMATRPRSTVQQFNEKN